MTNLDLAQKIAYAVLYAADRDGEPVAAVLDVLHETGHAFARLTEDDKGVTLWQCMDDDAERMSTEALERSRARQQGLFT